jgi:predicted Zn finger-like uncharacterized protein
MPIETRCPHCQTSYRLKDELAGKSVTCRTATCRKVFAIAATPPTNSKLDSKPPAPVLDAEALAAELFSGDDGAQMVGEERQIAVVCEVCDHKWSEPASKVGKIVLCPECKHRQRIPEPKKKTADWRDPSGGRRLMEKGPELPKDLEEMQMKEASYGSLKQAGVIEEEQFEPRPLKQKLMFAALGLALLGGIAGGVWWFLRSRSEGQENLMMATAVDEIKEIKDEGPLPKGQPPLFRAVVHLAAGEYHARMNTEEGLKQSLRNFGDVLQDLNAAPRSLERDAIYSELAVALLAVGGDNDQVKSKTRIAWSPQNTSTNQPGTGQTRFVQVELRQLLTAMVAQGVDPEVRQLTIRRLAREFTKRGNPEVVFEVAQQAFTEAEKPEGLAQMLIEALAAGASPDKLKIPAGSLKSGDTPVPVSAVAVLQKLGLAADLKPQQLHQPIPGQPITSLTTAVAVIQSKALNENVYAVEIANGLGTPAERLMVLNALAEVAADPKSALDAAAEVVKQSGKSLTKPNSVTLWRLVRVAARTGIPEAADLFARAILDEGLKEWAMAEALRTKWAGAKATAPASEAPKPAANAARVGNAWGCLLFARHNAAQGGSADAAKVYDGWGKGELRGFGYAGLALGLQDRK